MPLCNLAVAVQQLPVGSFAAEVLAVHIVDHTVPMLVVAVHRLAEEVAHTAVVEAVGHKHCIPGSPKVVAAVAVDFAFQAVGPVILD